MDENVKRSFILGEKWLYYKIYSGSTTADLILVNLIKPLTELLLEKKLIEKWFFIRYSDPKKHLRIRFCLTDVVHIQKIINYITPLLKDLLSNDLIYKIQIDTYRRELERYGSDLIELTETLFFQDSIMIVSLLEMIEEIEKGEEIRWLLGLRAIDILLDSFKYTENQKLALANNLKTSYRNEFGVSKKLNEQLKDRYRKNRNSVDMFMSLNKNDQPKYDPLLKVLWEKQKATTIVAEVILEKQSKNMLNNNLDNLLESYIHMLMNRLFKSKNRVYEMVCYNFLYRYYLSVIARKD